MDKRKRATMKRLSGAAVATAAAGLFLGGVASTVSAAETGKIHCAGVNACKGQSDCKTANSECKGQNQCKGQGFVAMTPEDCKAKGGMIEKG